MIDIHCHILPDIDDGSSTMSQSIKMAKIAVKDGIKKIVATPHITDNPNLKQSIIERSNALHKALLEENIPLEIMTGGEIPFALDLDLVPQYSINNNRYVLIEFPHSHVPIDAKEYLSKLVYNNFLPIIVHPERNQMIIENPEVLLNLLNDKINTQVTAGSLVGMFGNNVKQCARHLMKKGVVTVLASDAHDEEYRPPIIKAGLKIAIKLLGKKQALKLVNENPLSIIIGDIIDGKGIV